MDRRNTQVSYHALALLELPFRFSKTGRAVSRPANRCSAIPDRAERHDRASQCDHGADGDRTHDLLTASQALSQAELQPQKGMDTLGQITEWMTRKAKRILCHAPGYVNGIRPWIASRERAGGAIPP